MWPTTYKKCKQNRTNDKWNKKEGQFWQISENKLCNRHFAPQFIWLFHLYKYFQGTVKLKPLKALENLIPKKINQSKNKTKIADVNNYLLVDNKLIEKYNNKNTALKIIIEDLIHVLS